MHTFNFICALFGSLALAQSSSAPTPTTSQCVNTITQHQPYGCTITNAAQTTTESIDCKGCILSTAFVQVGFFGHGPVCFGGRKTMTDAKVTATVQACATA
jgi:hypothetical protein